MAPIARMTQMIRMPDDSVLFDQTGPSWVHVVLVEKDEHE